MTVCVGVCVVVRLILVLVLGRQIVYGQNTVYLCLSKYIVFENRHPHITTAASRTEAVAAVSCMESHMNRRPLGSIDPNSIRQTEIHTECRRRRERESLYSPQHDRERDAARQRHGRKGCGRTDKEKLRGASRRHHKRQTRGVCVCIRPGLCLCLCASVLRALVACKKFGCK